MNSFWLVLALAFNLAAKTWPQREIALTFDDCPRKTGVLMSGMQRARMLTAALQRSQAGPVAFFCNLPTLQPDGLERLKYFAAAGHLIGNHTAHHTDLNKASPVAFVKEIDLADQALHTLPGFRKWFRFPYLHEGKNREDVEFVRAHLREIGYTNGYVTVDTQDWYMDDILGRMANAGRRFNKQLLCETYRDMLLDEAEMFDAMSVGTLGRSIHHTILLHETDLNALCIEVVIAGLRARGWALISPDLAYQDPIARMEPPANGKLNQGRLLALAKERGYKGAYYTKWIEEENIEKEFVRRGVWQTKK